MNEKTIEEFITHLLDGKPILNKKKKPIGKGTADKYRRLLSIVSEYFKKDLRRLTEEELTRFRNDLYQDKVKTPSGKKLQNSTKRDIEYKCLGMFLKWIGKPELVYYTDRYREEKEIPALKEHEVKQMVSQSRLREKVIIQVLYDSGARIDEFLNLRFCDIKDDERKSKGYYKIRIIKSKTKPRTIGLYMEDTTEIIDQWLDMNRDKIGTTERFIPLSYRHLSLNLKRNGDMVLKKKIYPHLMRHSSATYYCHKLNEFQLCKRYGWSMSSDMPKLYIDREGVDETDMAEKLMDEQAIEYRKEVNRLKEQMRIMEDKYQEKMNTIERLIEKKLEAEIRKKI